MKNKFNFLQISNWIYLCLKELEKFDTSSKEEKIKILTHQKNKFLILKKILLRERQLFGISSSFLKNLKDIKKEYGIE